MSRSSRLAGRSPPLYDDAWKISTVARRFLNSDVEETCYQTDETVNLDEPHYYVTLRRKASTPCRPDQYDHLILKDELALEAFEQSLEQ